MAEILLLGPGHSRRRFDIHGERVVESVFGPPDRLTIVDRDQNAAQAWEQTVHYYGLDLRGNWDYVLRPGWFDEVHAYEVLNLLPGDEHDFFRFWSRIWAVLKPGGTVMATVPHWNSEWRHAYPGPQRTYTPGLLSYLDPEERLEAKEDFSALWPSPFRFRREVALVDHAQTAFYFRLRKEVR